MAHLLAAYSRATPKQAKEPILATLNKLPLILFWTLVDKGHDLDRHKIEVDLTAVVHQPVVIIKFVSLS